MKPGSSYYAMSYLPPGGELKKPVNIIIAAADDEAARDLAKKYAEGQKAALLSVRRYPASFNG